MSSKASARGTPQPPSPEDFSAREILHRLFYLVLACCLFSFYIVQRKSAKQHISNLIAEKKQASQLWRKQINQNGCNRPVVEPALVSYCEELKAKARENNFPTVTQVVFGITGGAINEFLELLDTSIFTIFGLFFVALYFRSVRKSNKPTV